MGKEYGVSIIIPAHNEEKGVADTLAALIASLQQASFNYEIIVVNDGSTDNTGSILATLPIKIITNEINLGYGGSIKIGIHQAAHELICITDADGTYPNERIPDLVSELVKHNADMVVGARTGSQVAIPYIRRPAKWIIGKLANYSVARKIPDINSGLRVFRRDIAMNFFNLLPNGFSLTTTITLAMLSNNYRVRYTSINYFPRKGKSKIRPIHDTLNFLILIARIALYFAPLRIFMPLSFLFFILGLVWGITSYIWLGKVADLSTLVLILASTQLGATGMLAELVNHRIPNSYVNSRPDD